ncbi:Uncharacterised protein [Vibrio cholerae]|nr:Uncharacterised protein [Vibrio cholerae]CSC04920.1 Uncharacterised protein [Vibrio cholerae]CSC12727.1 Uncharacterised protein [Vibrio cholerae]CSD45141.1 Uncharacterised protein [Vibrio cholerae]CSI58082.1 Uncharacterised protein [Vibrio cholerae]
MLESKGFSDCHFLDWCGNRCRLSWTLFYHWCWLFTATELISDTECSGFCACTYDVVINVSQVLVFQTHSDIVVSVEL